MFVGSSCPQIQPRCADTTDPNPDDHSPEATQTPAARAARVAIREELQISTDALLSRYSADNSAQSVPVTVGPLDRDSESDLRVDLARVRSAKAEIEREIAASLSQILELRESVVQLRERLTRIERIEANMAELPFHRLYGDDA